LPRYYTFGPEAEKYMRLTVGKIVDEWWSRQRDNIVTDPAKMSVAQLNVLIDIIIEEIRDGSNHDIFHRDLKRWKAGDSANAANELLKQSMNQSKTSCRRLPVLLHPVMLELILARCAYFSSSEKGQEDYSLHVLYETIPALTVLARKGQSTELARVAEDQTQNFADRLCCILALYRAGEPLKTKELLQILEVEPQLDNQLVVLVALGFGDESAVPVLLRFMDNTNTEIATAAAIALQKARPEEALPKLKKLIHSDRLRPGSAYPLFEIIAKYRNETSRKILAEYLEESLHSGNPHRELLPALAAFHDVFAFDMQSLFDGELTVEETTRLALAKYRELVDAAKNLLMQLSAQLENAEAQLEAALAIEKLRCNEYERLLGLQLNGVATSKLSTQARDHLIEARSEVEAHRENVRKAELKLENWSRRLK